MITGVMVIRVPIPSAFPRVSGLVLLPIVDAEVVGLEPADPKVRTRDPAWEVSEIVVGDESVRSIRRLRLDVIESITPDEVGSDTVEDFRIDGATTRWIRRVVRHRCVVACC